MSKGKTENTSIGIFGPYGFGNMGDAALADATIQGIRRYQAKARIIGICQHPVNAKLRHNIDTFSIFSNFIKPSYELKKTVVENCQQAVSDQTIQYSNVEAPTSLRKKLISSIKSLPFVYSTAKNIQKKLVLFKGIFRELQYSRSIYKLAKSLDLIIVAGSGQFNEDWGGAWRYPFALFRWALIARLSGCNVAFFSVGAGNINSFWARKFCTWSLKLAIYKSFRDQRTFSMARAWGIDDGILVPDMAFSIRFPETTKILTKAKKIVGINPIAYCDPRAWYVADQDAYKLYIEKMSMLCMSILDDGYLIHFIPNELKMDNPVIDDIISKMSLSAEQANLIERPNTETPDDVFSNLSNCDLVIACRFHGLLFSYMAKKPTIALAFHFKYFLLAEEMGQEKYCLDIANFKPDQVKSLFEDLVNNRDSVSQTIQHRFSDYFNQVEQQYQKIDDLIA